MVQKTWEKRLRIHFLKRKVSNSKAVQNWTAFFKFINIKQAVIQLKFYLQCDILIVRNKLNSQKRSNFFICGVFYTLFAHSIITNLIKMQIPLDRIASLLLCYYRFVSRQRGLRFLCVNFGWRTFLIKLLLRNIYGKQTKQNRKRRKIIKNCKD